MIKQLLEFIVSSTVNDANAVEIIETVDDSAVVFKIKVKNEDRGRLIGREGRTIRSIRSLAQNMAEKEGRMCVIELVD